MMRWLVVLIVVAGSAHAERAKPPTPAPPAAVAGPCHPATLEERGIAQLAMGNTAAAFAAFEKAIACAPSERLYQRAIIAACRLTNSRFERRPHLLAKVKQYMAKLRPDAKAKMMQVCTPPCDPFWDMRER